MGFGVGTGVFTGCAVTFFVGSSVLTIGGFVGFKVGNNVAFVGSEVLIGFVVGVIDGLGVATGS